MSLVQGGCAPVRPSRRHSAWFSLLRTLACAGVLVLAVQGVGSGTSEALGCVSLTTDDAIAQWPMGVVHGNTATPPCFRAVQGRSHPTVPRWGCLLSGPSGKSLLTSGLDARGLAPRVADAGGQWSQEGQECPAGPAVAPGRDETVGGVHGQRRRQVGCMASAGGGWGTRPARGGAKA